MSLFSLDVFKSKTPEETQLAVVVEILHKINSAMAETVSLAKTTYNPEIGLAQSIKDSIYLLDSDQDVREESYILLSTSYHGRAVTGRLQRVQALREEMDELFKRLEELKNG